MNRETAESIKQGLREAATYARGERVPGLKVNTFKKAGGRILRTAVTLGRTPAQNARHTVEVPSVDVAAMRARLKMSQPDFAHKFGFSLATVRNWEQGRRPPQGAARVLLTVIDKNPKAVLGALAGLR